MEASRRRRLTSKSARRGYLALWLVSTVFVAGCGSGDPASLEAPSGPGIQRLLQHGMSGADELQTEPLAVPLDDAWQVDGDGPLQRDASGLRLAVGAHPVRISRAVDFDASCYNVFRLTLEVDAETRCEMRWTSDLEPAFGNTPPLSSQVLAGAGPHTVLFSLDSVATEAWVGRITGVALSFSGEASAAVVSAVEFVRQPHPAPRRVTICGQTREAVFGGGISWELVIPSQAVLETQVGLLERAWNPGSSDGVVFRVSVEPAGPGASPNSRALVAERSMNPAAVEADRQWVPLRVDLAAHAGEQVRIWFDIDPLGSRLGDYAFWGNPTLLNPREETGSFPVVLISCDTLRADHMSCYGYERPTTPGLDAFANEAILFENAMVPETWTITSHMSMLTGLYPKNHGISPSANLAEEAVTIAEFLQSRGYLTAGFTGHDLWLLPWRGFSHGFDVYDVPTRHFRDVRETGALAQEWMRQHREHPMFLFLHNYDIHSKSSNVEPSRIYDPGDPAFREFSATSPSAPAFSRKELKPTPQFTEFLMAHNQGQLVVTPDERQFLLDGYDDSIRYVDDAVRRLLDDIRSEGWYDRALIIVTSDHGEEFDEHGRYLHVQLYDECSRVPLLVKLPHGEQAGKRVNDLVCLTDIVPTITGLLGSPETPSCDGESLLPIIRGESRPDRRVFMQRFAWQSVRTPTAQLVRSTRTGRREYYDLTTAPGGTQNPLEPLPEDAAVLEQALDEFFAPPEDGWHIVFENDGTPWTARLVLTTDDRFESIQLARGDRIGDRGFQITGQAAEGQVLLAAHLQREVLSVQTVSPGASVRLHMTSDGDFDVMGGAVEGPTKDLTLVLNPSDAQFAGGEYEGPPGTTPKISIRYGHGSASQTPAKDLTPQDLEELKALGYVQ